MFKALSNMPIFRRFFLAFALAALIPGVVIVILGVSFIGLQKTRSQAIQTGTRAVNDSAAFSPDPQAIQLILNTIVISYGDALRDHLPGLPASAFVINPDQRVCSILTGKPIPTAPPPLFLRPAHYTPGMPCGATMGTGSAYSNIFNIEVIFDNAIKQHQQLYQVATSDQMAITRDILATDDLNDTLVQGQQDTLNEIVNNLWLQYQADVGVVLGEIISIHSASALTTGVNAVTMDYTKLSTSLGQLTQIEQNIADKVAIVGPSQLNPIILSTVIATLSTILVILLIGYIVNLTITNPLRQLATLTKRIAKGETSIRAKATGRDEIALVASSMNNMLDNIVRLIQETQSQRDVLQAQVEKLVSEVSGVGEGDLRIQAEVTTDALGVLADSFNYMVEELGSLVVRVKVVAHEVENSTSLTLDRMTQLVESEDNQIEQIAEATVEVEQMAGSSRQVAERTQVLYTVASNARHNAAGGREAVQQAVEGMGRIYENVQATSGKVQLLGERSREINNIVEAISTIAHQTNRLALDAAIQAAMAGENGKGFGAVAADIRRLAERAKDQAGMIARIVRSVREDIGSAALAMQDTERETSAGAKLTQEAGSSLELLFAAVEHQAREIETINHMAVQQLQTSGSVVQIMRGVSDSTQQNSVSTREASQSMERLARLVEQLRASVEAFKLRENQGYYIPRPGMSITQDDLDGPLTVSGIFRTVSATAHSQLPSGGTIGTGNSGMPNALPSPRGNAGELGGYPSYSPLSTGFYPQEPSLAGTTPVSIPPTPFYPPYPSHPAYPQNATQKPFRTPPLPEQQQRYKVPVDEHPNNGNWGPR